MTIFKSPYPDVEIPDVGLTEFVLGGAAARGDKPALIDGPTGRTITYGELAIGTQLVAASLAERGFKKGDVFAIFSPNVPEYAVAFHGVAAAGGIATTINPLYTTDELTFQLKDSKAKYLLTIPQFLDRAQEAAKNAGVEEVFVLGEAEGATPVTELLAPKGDAPKVDISRDDLVVLPYSSGTTGLPKGVMLTHGNLVANIAQSLDAHGTNENDVIIGVLPFFHIYGMTVIMNMAVRAGATIVTMPKFDLEEFLTLMQDHKVTRAYLVPPIILALAKHPIVEKYDLSALEVIMSGAAPLGEDLQEAAQNRVGGVVMQGYGLTETSPVTHMNPDEEGKGRVGSIGFLIPNTESKIVDVESGKELEANGTGEVLIRGPQVMKGYLNNDEATKRTIDSEGFLHSGDIGYVDDDGYFFLVDRLKELIKYKGFQVPPAELEAVLLSHPNVGDAAVIGVPDEAAGELPKAFVVKSGEVTEDEIMSFVAERVAPHKKIRIVEFTEEIPKSASGKILRRVLIEKERAAAS
ncbi:MAG: 4-coumarate--CoA ligase family protein [Actinomycetota bacterium]